MSEPNVIVRKLRDALDGGESPQDSDVFREWMTEFAKEWASFLDSTESFDPDALRSFIDNSPQ